MMHYFALKKYLRSLKFYVFILTKAVLQYLQEMCYYLRAKKPYMIDEYPKNNPALFLRKKAHHLERCLFAPNSYSSDFAKATSKDIEKILNNAKGIPSAQEKWAQKILNEYKAKDQHDSPSLCPMQINNVKRKQSSIKSEELMKLFRQRRSRRIFLDIPLTIDEKKAICDVAQYAPSACKRQTIYLLFVENPELKDFVATTIPGGYQFFSKAPCILLLISDAGDYRYPDERTIPYIDGAAAMQNIYLLCETMGLGCCFGSYSSFGGIDKEKEVRTKLKIPINFLIVGSMAIGKSDQFVCEIPRDLPEKRFWIDYYGKR